MQPRASTSKLASHDGAQHSRSPSATASLKGRRDPSAASVAGGQSDMSTTMMEDGGAAASSDDELLDEEDEDQQQYGGSNARSKSSANARSRTSKGRSSTSASVAGAEDHHQQHSQNDGQTGLSKEEAALADRRRRNRETQRAIRKKKANRLQEAEVKVSLFEGELEKLKVRLREMELENMSLKREIEDWRLGRIQANPSLVAASHQHHPHSHPHRHQLPPPAAATVASASAGRRPHVEDRLQQHPSYDGYHGSVPYTGSSMNMHYQSYDLPSDERTLLGKKRRQSFDASHHDQHAVRTSPQSMSARRPILNHGSPPIESQLASRDSPSVLQPMPTVPHERLTPDLEQVARDRVNLEDVSVNSRDIGHMLTASMRHQFFQRPALDTNSNGEGSYGGSDPSPSSAGTVVPSYNSTFTATAGEPDVIPSSTVIGEAVQAIRKQEANAKEATVAFRDSLPRSASIMSTVSTSISDSSSTNKRSYDDYHDFWTSVSTGTNSQSQSDSLTSMSSYSRHASSSNMAGPTVSSGYAAAGGLTTPGGSAIADGMILSMSRQSLCASPVSIAEERDEPMQAAEVAREAPVDIKMKPSLPSLSSTLGTGRYPPDPRSPDRTASLPPPVLNVAGSPPNSYLPSMHAQGHYPSQYQPHHLQRYPGYPIHDSHSNPHAQTLPPISSIYQSRQNALPQHPSEGFSHRPTPVTRNGRGKSTSFPILAGSDVGGLERLQDVAAANWPTSSRPSPGPSSSFGGPILPLPRRAGARPPMSSTRDDSSSAFADDVSKEDHVVKSPSQYNDSAVLDIEMTEADLKDSQAADKRQPQRRKSTYDDFVEVFGA